MTATATMLSKPGVIPGRPQQLPTVTAGPSRTSPRYYVYGVYEKPGRIESVKHPFMSNRSAAFDFGVPKGFKITVDYGMGEVKVYG